MYAKHFGLRQEPFSIAPDPRYLYMSERHREALAHLLYGLRGTGGIVLLTGEIGAGKTTVCRCFLEQIPPKCNVAYIFNPKLTVIELLRSVCDEFHIPHGDIGGPRDSVKDYVDVINRYLLRTHAIGENNVLIIDEAQNLAVDVLEQLRLLTNLETRERKLLQIVLIGQPELRDMLAQPALEQLAQRVTARYHLEALDASETTEYIRHRLMVAGRTGTMPFDREARSRVHDLSRGIPRRINVLCDRAMLGAYAEGVQRITRGMIDKAASEVFAPSAAAAGPAVPWPWLHQRWPWLARRWRWWAGGAAACTLMLVAGTSLWRDSPSADTKASAASAALSMPGTAASGAAGIAPMAPIRPLRDERRAWRLLALTAKANLDDGDTCESLRRQKMNCVQRTGVDATTLRKSTTPSILVLRGEDGQVGYVVYTGQADERSLSLRGDGGDVMRLDWMALTSQWRGEVLAIEAAKAPTTTASVKR